MCGRVPRPKKGTRSPLERAFATAVSASTGSQRCRSRWRYRRQRPPRDAARHQRESGWSIWWTMRPTGSNGDSFFNRYAAISGSESARSDSNACLCDASAESNRVSSQCINKSSSSRMPRRHCHFSLDLDMSTFARPCIATGGGMPQCRLSASIFFVAAMAFAGFRPLGQACVQFMIVWQRYSRNGSSRKSRRSPVASSRLSTSQR